MGIADVRTSLESGAAGKASFKDVRLSYQNGGEKQILKFSYQLNIEGAQFADVERDFPGNTNPVAMAYQIGEEIAALFDLTS